MNYIHEEYWMIESFRHKRLKNLYERGERRGLPAENIERLERVIAALDEARTLDDLTNPSFRLHPLTGDLAGQWSIRVNRNWRIVFRFEDGRATEVDLLDYH